MIVFWAAGTIGGAALGTALARPHNHAPDPATPSTP
ncbi:hypothetical protein HNR40_007144 [Nonomuraea endophytica]|uniref:Uncharacterized protein n=1 Tax=Nonomuraea endophytica TaxID=714136 RepID=A0A7W8A9R2_9ACTN|nr:hypothetical protein [Nonomuraea endophytica]